MKCMELINYTENCMDNCINYIRFYNCYRWYDYLIIWAISLVVVYALWKSRR